ncbi:hypothetical protein GH714_031799 [Hevea brasiliensis]|uniref:Uncharacterized protein n=1 Tax=Hevea brasiliensis TaxID=3981 RepID=A0A6A6LFQ1_HEVBR|nr:hypothetical protein GH714_031799 [Hevea brasiliensis]
MSSNVISPMEVQATKVVKPEADQACGSHDRINVEDGASGSNVQPIEEAKEPSDIVIDTEHLQERLDSLKKEAAGKPVKTRIQRVPYMLRENKELEKYYKPTVVAIGPIHCKDPNFEYGERMKRSLTGEFIKEHAIEAGNLYRRIMKDLKKLKMCYAEDGMNINNEQVALAEQDILLLENQLPYELLELLISSFVQENKKKTIRDSITNFISSRKIFLPQAKSRKEPSPSSATVSGKEPLPSSAAKTRKDPPCHLLDLLRQEMLVDFIKPIRRKDGTSPRPNSEIKVPTAASHQPASKKKKKKKEM